MVAKDILEFSTFKWPVATYS